ncbi:MAG TPA: hypothetical protein VFB78_17880 [Acidimicrobiales bacterium]|nr:hypothetical protein [Acidimicrobiales bacterium]
MTTFDEIARVQRGYIDRVQAGRGGLSRGQIQRLTNQHHFQRPQRGVYLTGSAPSDWEGNVRAACLAAGGDARAMGRTAARLHGMDGAEKHGVIELTVSIGRGPTPRGVIVHVTRKTEPELTTTVNGIPVSSVNQTLLEYAWLTRSDLLVERAVEDSFRRGKSTEGALRRFVGSRGKGVPGVTRVRSVLDSRPKGRPARSGFEVIVLDILREYGLELPERRPLLRLPPDRVFELDLAYMHDKVDIEPMGEKWHATARQRRDDAERRRLLAAIGWTVVDVWWQEAMHSPWSVADRVRSARS